MHAIHTCMPSIQVNAALSAAVSRQAASAAASASPPHGRETAELHEMAFVTVFEAPPPAPPHSPHSPHSPRVVDSATAHVRLWGGGSSAGGGQGLDELLSSYACEWCHARLYESFRACLLDAPVEEGLRMHAYEGGALPGEECAAALETIYGSPSGGHISPHLLAPPQTSVHLPIPPHTSAYLRILTGSGVLPTLVELEPSPPHISADLPLYLPASRLHRLGRAAHAGRARARRLRRQ